MSKITSSENELMNILSLKLKRINHLEEMKNHYLTKLNMGKLERACQLQVGLVSNITQILNSIKNKSSQKHSRNSSTNFSVERNPDGHLDGVKGEVKEWARVMRKTLQRNEGLFGAVRDIIGIYEREFYLPESYNQQGKEIKGKCLKTLTMHS